MEVIIILFTFLLIPYVIRFIKTEGTMYSEKVICKNGKPHHIICRSYNLFGVDNHTIIKVHPESLTKKILYHANDPTIKYVSGQIKKHGFWCENDSIPQKIIEESKKYRENYKNK